MPLQQAIDAPHFGSRNGPTDLETGTPVAGLRQQLEALGHPVRVFEMASGVHAIQRVGAQWVGAADPRRDGIARGE
jgi:gamma-glutamyltranspeptidase/glutathione hydrolase